MSCQYSSRSSGTSPSSRSHGTCRVVMSSIRRARSSASASADAGRVHDQRGLAGSRGLSGATHCSTSCASSSRRSSGRSASGSSSASAPFAASAKASSSSSMSPSGTMRGSTAASVSSTSRKASRASAQARRVGRNSVAFASASGSAESGKPSISRPSRSARISVGRNGAEAGMVKTRGGMRAVIGIVRRVVMRGAKPHSPGSPPRPPRSPPACRHASRCRRAAGRTAARPRSRGRTCG